MHARSEDTWPERSAHFSTIGDIVAARHLLESRTPLVWFDTNTKLVVWLTDPSLCSSGFSAAPTLTRRMYFDQTNPHGRMRFVSKIDVKRTWQLFYDRAGCPDAKTKEMT